MIPLYTQEQYDNANSKELLPLQCEHCKEPFLCKKTEITYRLKNNLDTYRFCSRDCARLSRGNAIIIKCDYCGIDFEKQKRVIKITKNNYCSQNCYALSQVNKVTFNCEYCGIHVDRVPSKIKQQGHVYCSVECRAMAKTTRVTIKCEYCGIDTTKPFNVIGKYEHYFCSASCMAKYRHINKPQEQVKVSKLEKHIQSHLDTMYPELQILYNYRDCRFTELDIYIPELGLAVEINGPGHYKPIYSEATFSRTQYNDALKAQRCIESGISLLVIDTSEQRKFTPETSAPYLAQVISLIESALQA